MVDQAAAVRLRDADIINVSIDIEPVAFNRGYYSVDITYYFDVELDITLGHRCPANCVHGLCVYTKKVILYGSEGGVKVFSSNYSYDQNDVQNKMTQNIPKATVQVASPVSLGAKLEERCNCGTIPGFSVPSWITSRFSGDFSNVGSEKVVYVTLGVFSIIQIERNVSMLIHAYDFCMPEKRCVEGTNENPCDLFRRLRFPTEEFFPPKAGELRDASDIIPGCGCCK
ncbi:MAG: hypothetical protein IJL87_07685 [Clostridia bacterium]|nr:hypothetical protein [Clostridia bacterium]